MSDTVYISFIDYIDKNSLDNLMATCNKALKDHPSTKKIYMFFSSPGGNINTAFTLFTFIKALPVKVIMHGSGVIDSSGVNVFLSGDSRYTSKGTTFLLHPATKLFNKDVSITIEQLKSELMALQKEQEKIIQNILENTIFTEKEVTEHIQSGVTLDVASAQEKGIITEVRDFTIDPQNPFYQVAKFEST